MWTDLEAVEGMDLSAFYGAYRSDGHDRPAYEPSMMVALLLYAYARGNRSSRAIERECREDVAYRVIAANRAPDHSTIAEFRKRHEAALAGLFGEVLKLCRTAGMVNVGLIAIDGTKVHANASNMVYRDYRQIAMEILAEAARVDREEDELYGDARGDELPEHLRTAEGRKAALAEAKRKLERERAGERNDDDSSLVSLELDPAVLGPGGRGRRGWLLEARRQLDAHRQREAHSVSGSRVGQLLAAEQRLAEDLDVERGANAAYEANRARGVDHRGWKLGGVHRIRTCRPTSRRER